MTDPDFNKTAADMANHAEQAMSQAVSRTSEMQEQMRKAAEQTAEQGRAAYARMKTAADDATGSMEATYAATSKGVVELGTKALEALQTNVEAQFAFMKSLLAVKSMPEAVSLQTEHLRKQMETMQTQARELSSVAQRVATASVEPMKTVSKAFTPN